MPLSVSSVPLSQYPFSSFEHLSLIRISGLGIRVFPVPDIDLFNFFRWWLSWIVTIYASILTLQSLWNWYLWLAGQDKYIGMLRRYLIVHGLRLRFKAFWGDVIITVLLCVAFLLLWRAHHAMYALQVAMRK